MKKVSVVYHSGYGHATNVANAIVTGIDNVENVTANLISIDQEGEVTEADWLALDESDAIVLARPPIWAWPPGSSKSLPTPLANAGHPHSVNRPWAHLADSWRNRLRMRALMKHPHRVTLPQPGYLVNVLRPSPETC